MDDPLVQHAAKALDASPAAVAAVMEIESSGSGMLPPHPETGERRAVVRFEGATFHGLTDGRFDDARPDLSMESWRDNAQHVRRGWAEWGRIAEAAELDEPAAYMSASYGAFQIMGFNYGLCGFANVRSFVTAMNKGEEHQVDAFIAFLRAKRLDEALRRKNWSGFARGYNGGGQVAHYAGKLSKAYQRHKDRLPSDPPVTPPRPERKPTPAPPATTSVPRRPGWWSRLLGWFGR